MLDGPVRDVPGAWPDAKPFIERGLEHGSGEYTVRDVFDGLVEGRFQLWLGYIEGKLDAVLVTEIVEYPQYRSCILRLVAGNIMDHWLPHLGRSIKDWARAHGCRDMKIEGRPGWKRVLKGWRETHTVLRLEL